MCMLRLADSPLSAASDRHASDASRECRPYGAALIHLHIQLHVPFPLQRC